MNGKVWYASKTLWVNAIALALSVCTGAFGIDPKLIATALGVGLPVINIILRFVTNEPIVITPSDVGQ